MSSYAKLYINVVLSVVIMTMSINISHTKSELDWDDNLSRKHNFSVTFQMSLWHRQFRENFVS